MFVLSSFSLHLVLTLLIFRGSWNYSFGLQAFFVGLEERKKTLKNIFFKFDSSRHIDCRLRCTSHGQQNRLQSTQRHRCFQHRRWFFVWLKLLWNLCSHAQLFYAFLAMFCTQSWSIRIVLLCSFVSLFACDFVTVQFFTFIRCRLCKRFWRKIRCAERSTRQSRARLGGSRTSGQTRITKRCRFRCDFACSVTFIHWTAADLCYPFDRVISLVKTNHHMFVFQRSLTTINPNSSLYAIINSLFYIHIWWLQNWFLFRGGAQYF